MTIFRKNALILCCLIMGQASHAYQPNVKNALATPLGKKLTEANTPLLPELLALVISYVQFSHTCRENVPVYALEALPDNTIAAGLGNGEIHIIDPSGDPLNKETTLKILRGHAGPVTALKWLVPEQLLLSGSTVNGNAILSLNDFYSTDDHRVKIVGLNNQNKILSWLNKSDERLMLWKPHCETPVQTIQPQVDKKENFLWRLLHKIPLWGTQATGIYLRFISLTTNQHIDDCLIDSDPQAVLSNGQRMIFETTSKITCEKRFASYQVDGCADGNFTIINLQSRKLTYGHGHTKPIRAIQPISDHLVATAAEDGVIYLWCAQTSAWIATIDERHRGPIYALAVISKPHPLLIAGFADGAIRIYSREIAECRAAQEKNAKASEEELKKIEEKLANVTLE